MPRYKVKHYSGYVWMKLTFEAVDWVKQIVLTMWAGLIQFTEGLNRTKIWAIENCSLCLQSLSWDSSSGQTRTQTRIYTIRSPGFQVFRLSLEWYITLLDLSLSCRSWDFSTSIIAWANFFINILFLWETPTNITMHWSFEKYGFNELCRYSKY